MTWRRAGRAVWSGTGVAAAILSFAGPASAQFMDKEITVFTLADQLEYGTTGPGRPVQWDMSGWVGDSYTRLWIKSEGDWETVGGARQFDLRAEYSRLISPFWELQGGVRLEVSRRGSRTDTRAHLEPELFIAQDGQVAVRLAAEYDLLLTQRLIAHPRFETYGAFSENLRFGVGPGLTHVKPGLRLRYETPPGVRALRGTRLAPPVGGHGASCAR